MQAESLGWFKSYLGGRSQQVSIEGSLSDAGVPQGFVLGPLIYAIFTNNLSKAAHDHLAEGNSLYNIHCHSCGGMCSFADDSTITERKFLRLLGNSSNGAGIALFSAGITKVFVIPAKNRIFLTEIVLS